MAAVPAPGAGASLVDVGVGANGEQKRKRAAEAFGGPLPPGSEVKKQKLLGPASGAGTHTSSPLLSHAGQAGYSPETSVTPSIGAGSWDSPARPGSAAWSAEPTPVTVEARHRNSGNSGTSGSSGNSGSSGSSGTSGKHSSSGRERERGRGRGSGSAKVETGRVSTSRSGSSGSSVGGGKGRPHSGARKPAARGGGLYSLRIHTFIKANLLSQFCRKPGYRVVDVGCGTGRDLVTFASLGIREWVGIDRDMRSLSHAASVYNALLVRGYAARFVCANPCALPVWESVGPVATGGAGFDLACAQRALGAAFGSEATARMMLWNLSAWLKPGAFVVGTTLDARAIGDRVAKAGGKAGSGTVGNTHFSLSVNTAPTPASSTGSGTGYGFGASYVLRIKDGAEAGSCETGFLVPLDKLACLATEYGLDLVVKDNYIKAYRAYKKAAKHNKVLKHVNPAPAEWERVALYLVFALKKSGSHVLDPPQAEDMAYKPIDTFEHHVEVASTAVATRELAGSPVHPPTPPLGLGE